MCTVFSEVSSGQSLLLVNQTNSIQDLQFKDPSPRPVNYLGEVHLRWTPNRYARIYKIEVYKANGELHEEIVTKRSFTYPKNLWLEEGQTETRFSAVVSAIDSKRNVISKSNPIQIVSTIKSANTNINNENS